MPEHIDVFIDEVRYVVWYHIHGEWVSRPLTDKLRYLSKLEVCPPTLTSAETWGNDEARLVVAFGRMADLIETIGSVPEGAGSRHKLGFYQQGAN